MYLEYQNSGKRGENGGCVCFKRTWKRRCRYRRFRTSYSGKNRQGDDEIILCTFAEAMVLTIVNTQFHHKKGWRRSAESTGDKITPYTNFKTAENVGKRRQDVQRGRYTH